MHNPLAIFVIAMFASVILSLMLAFAAGQTAKAGVCETIADYYLELVKKQEMYEISLEKHKQDRYWEKLLFFDNWEYEESLTFDRVKRTEGKFLTIQLMKEMQQVREKILKSTLQSASLLSSFPLRNGQNWTDGIASESQLRALIQEDVTQIYVQLRNLKIAEWNQENENEEGTTYPSPNPELHSELT